MSRRVFDVGLDMGRIRNGLKHNKDGKRTKSTRSTATTEDRKSDVYTDDTPFPNEQMAMVPQIKHKKSSPTIVAQIRPDQPNDTVNLPSPHSDYPTYPSQRSSSQEYMNGERSLHSSQLNPTHQNGSPWHALKPDQGRRLSDNAQNFELRAPPPNTKVNQLDTLSENLFSGDHLRVIIKDPTFFLRFTAFLNRYRPQSAAEMVRYLEAQKAIKAIEYANALAESMKPVAGEQSGPYAAATVDPRFEARLNRSFESLVNEALPAFITYSLTKVVTDHMVREITGTSMPVMRALVGGLAEIFCLADPSIEDCPIIYASEEFYRTTRYNRDDVIGKNCRFLQGPKSNRNTVARIRAAIKSGQESCETLLNYRRDGSHFMNLLLTAPLYDNRGSVRYFIGAQIDVSGLIEDGRGLESFERYLANFRSHPNRDSEYTNDSLGQKHIRALDELGQMLSVDESSVFQRHSRDNSTTDTVSSIHYPSRHIPNRRDPSMRLPRRVIGSDEDNEDQYRNDWALSSTLNSGRLPGVYQNYLLLRPHPSLRIIFVSPALRIPGLLQSPFLSRIGGPPHVRSGLSDAFAQGAAVTAKVTWLPQGQPADTDNSRPGTSRGGPSEGARTRYISCTPLLGSDDQVGVWMVVMVENEMVTGALPSRRYNNTHPIEREVQPTPSEYGREDPVPALMEDAGTGVGLERNLSGHSHSRAGRTVGSEGGRLYAEFMRGTTKKSAGGGGGGGIVNGGGGDGGGGAAAAAASPTAAAPLDTHLNGAPEEDPERDGMDALHSSFDEKLNFA